MNYLTSTNILGIFAIVALVGWKFGYASDTDVTWGLILMVGILVLDKLLDIEKRLQKIFDSRRGDAFDQNIKQIEIQNKMEEKLIKILETIKGDIVDIKSEVNEL